MKFLTILFIAILLTASCKKEAMDTRISSVWYINGQQFQTKIMNMLFVDWEVDGMVCINDSGIMCQFVLAGNHFGEDRFSSNPAFAASNCLFLFHGKKYFAPYDTFIPFQWVVGRNLQFAIDSAWVYNFIDGNDIKQDSVLVWGGFSGPYSME